MKKRKITKKKAKNISLKSIVITLSIIMILTAVPVIAIIASGGGYKVTQFFMGLLGGPAQGGGYEMRFLITASQPGHSNAEGGSYFANIGSFGTSVTGACSLSMTFSDTFANVIHWDVSGLPATEIDADGNNGVGITEYNISITATGCTADLEIRANSDLTFGVNTILLANEKYTYNGTNSSVPIGTKTSLTTSFVDVDTNLTTQVTFFKFFLDVPDGQPTGTYNNTLDLRVTQS